MAIIWTPPPGWIEETGASIRFKAPCSCADADSIVIGNNTYSFVDAAGNAINTRPGSFASGAVVEALLDTSGKKAYLNTPGTYLAPITITPDQLDTTTTNGYYRILSNSTTIAGWEATDWWLHVIRYNSDYCVQEVFPMTSRRVKLIRWCYSGEWYEEWENPPMYVGVEYRTTERDGGNPVYVKRVQYEFSSTIGNASSTTSTNIAHSISGFRKLVRCQGRISGTNYQFPYISTSGGITAVSAVNATNIVLRVSNMTWNANTFEFDLFYTKG